MHTRIVIVEKTRVKTLCLSVLNDDNTVVHQICKYKYFHPWYILWAYSIVHQNNENNNNNDQTLNGSFSKKSTVSLLFCITQVYPLEYFRFHIRTQQNNLSITFTF